MAHKTLVGGTAYAANGGRALVNGTGYGIKKGRTLVGGTGYDINFVSYDPVFANNDWAAIIEACQTRNIPSTWTVGSQKAMTINGKEYPIDIIGLGHDTYADGSGKAPITFQMHDCYDTKYTMNSTATNVGGWGSCAMRTTHLPAIMALMPSNVQSAIREVSKTTDSVVTADKLFLLSRSEIAATGYPYYKDTSLKAKTRNGTECAWWTRDPYSTKTTGFFGVLSGGSTTMVLDANNTNPAVSFAFCF